MLTDKQRTLIRELAVRQVDERNGYSVEHAHDQLAVAAQYTDRETQIATAVKGFMLQTRNWERCSIYFPCPPRMSDREVSQVISLALVEASR